MLHDNNKVLIFYEFETTEFNYSNDLEYKMKWSCISQWHLKYSIYLKENTVKLPKVGGRHKLKQIIIVIYRYIEIALEKEYLTMKIMVHCLRLIYLNLYQE